MAPRLSTVALAAVLASVALAAATSARAAADAVSAARFSITVDGVEIASFAELDGSLEAAAKKLPGKRTPPMVVLKRGMSANLALSTWQAGAARDATLVMYNADGKPVARYHLEQAWPSKVEVGALDASKNEVAIESVVLVFEGLSRIS